MAGSSKKVIYAALVGNSLIAITKFIAAAITGSSAMISEGIHSVVDTGNQVLLLHGLRQAKKPPSAEFPFGHGREVYLWSFVVAIILFALGAGVSAYEGVQHILHPKPMASAQLNYIVLSLALLFEGGALIFAVREFSKRKGNRGFIEAVRIGKDPTLFVVLFEDSAASIGLVVAFLGIWLSQVTGNPIYDGIASAMIALILAATAVWLAMETKGLLIGEAAKPRVIAGIHTLASKVNGVEQVNEILTMHMGPDDVLLNLSLDFQDDLAVGSIEQIIEQLDQSIKNQFPEVKRIFIEAESAPLLTQEKGNE